MHIIRPPHRLQTPRQVALTPGLRHAACDGMLRDSARQTVVRIETRADEPGILAKTTVLEILEFLTWRPRRTGSITPATIYRLIDREHPTLLLDEADNLGMHRNDALRAVLNDGHGRGGTTMRS